MSPSPDLSVAQTWALNCLLNAPLCLFHLLACIDPSRFPVVPAFFVVLGPGVFVVPSAFPSPWPLPWPYRFFGCFLGVPDLFACVLSPFQIPGRPFLSARRLDPSLVVATFVLVLFPGALHVVPGSAGFLDYGPVG